LDLFRFPLLASAVAETTAAWLLLISSFNRSCSAEERFSNGTGAARALRCQTKTNTKTDISSCEIRMKYWFWWAIPVPLLSEHSIVWHFSIRPSGLSTVFDTVFKTPFNADGDFFGSWGRTQHTFEKSKAFSPSLA